MVFDPSLPEAERLAGNARTSKMIMDATRYDAREFEVVSKPKIEAAEKVERDWAKYGILLPA